MKTLSLVATSTVFMLSLVSTDVNAKDPYLSPDWERTLVRVCEAIRDGKKLQLRKLLKMNRLTYRSIQKGLVCNGHDPVTFAAIHGNSKMATLVAKRSGANIDVDSLVASN